MIAAGDVLAPQNPVDGDPDAIDLLARELRETAEQLRDFSADCSRVGQDEDWQGDTAVAFREKQAKIPETVRTIETRFRTVSDALGVFAARLRDARDQASRAQFAARQAEDDRRRADTQVKAQQAGQPPDSPGAILINHWSSVRGEAHERLTAAIFRVDEALNQRDAAARACADQIRRACDDGLNNSWGWAGNFLAWVGAHSEGIAQVATWLGYAAAVLGILALFLTGPIGWVAFGVGVASLLVNASLWAAGEGDFSSVAWDLFGVATFGIGKVVSAGAKTARGATAMRLLNSAHPESRWVRLTPRGFQSPIRVPKPNIEAVASKNGYGSFRTNVVSEFSQGFIDDVVKPLRPLSTFVDDPAMAVRQTVHELRSVTKLVKFRPPPELPGLPHLSLAGKRIEQVGNILPFGSDTPAGWVDVKDAEPLKAARSVLGRD
jgi:uncharacterized protein YukE